MSHLFYGALSLWGLLLIVAGIVVLRIRDYEAASAIALGLVVVMVVMLTACSARAEDWLVASTSSAGDIFEIDLDTLTVWQDGSVSIKIEEGGENTMVQNFDCTGHFIILAPPNNLGIRRVVRGSSAANIEHIICGIRDRVLAEAK